ncbi:cytochrome P450 [Streptomyces sp. NPDC053048]|uniref:cytochrome P450 n=1 Tax=Streptomyces sp. NPDC053048 TaxID=3365694 RepID=UPI0037D84288
MPESEHEPYRYGFDEPYRLEPTPLYAGLRSAEPVARVRLPYGQEGWLVTRYESVRTVLSDPRFSRAAAVAAGERIPRPGPLPPRSNPMTAVDPPEHTRLRRLVAADFTKRRIERRRPRALQVATELIDDMIAAGPPADLVADFAVRLPVMMICEVLGIPQGERGRFSEWAVPLFGRTAFTDGQVGSAHTTMREFMAGLVAEKRRNPRDDLLTKLVRARDERNDLTEDQLIGLGVSLLSAGHHSTAHQIANCAYLLLTHPDQLAWLRADITRVPQAVEEMLRFIPLAAGAPNGEGHPRVATADVELDGVTIPAGEPVLASIISANRDEEVFPEAHRLDITRGDRSSPHIAFGHGPHHCLGAELARMEIQVATACLLTRFPALRLAVPEEEVPWGKGMMTRGPARLPVAW